LGFSFLNNRTKKASRQFHQRLTREFFVRIFRQSQNVTRKSCQNDVHTKNTYVKMLMKLTPEWTKEEISQICHLMNIAAWTDTNNRRTYEKMAFFK